MGRAPLKNLEFADIVAAIRKTRGGAATAATIAGHLCRSQGLVERALAKMNAAGLVSARPAGWMKMPRWVIVEDHLAMPAFGSIRPEPGFRGARHIPADPDHAEFHEVEPDDEAVTGFDGSFAARLWKERMGAARWHDDPRALAERMHQVHLMPPFLTHLAREA